MEQIFTNVYENAIWGNDNSKAYSGSSGGGSEIYYNENAYIPFLKQFIVDNNIKSVVDLGCGNFKCGTLIYDNLDIMYTGYDTYGKVIEYNKNINSRPKYNFMHMDFLNNMENIVNGDMCILKDVIQHWSLENIYSFLDYLVNSKKFKYILICNCCNQTVNNTNIKDGSWRELSCKFLPLKKYNAIELCRYNTKEVSLIRVYDDLTIG
jgi:hypothetical protein